MMFSLYMGWSPAFIVSLHGKKPAQTSIACNKVKRTARFYAQCNSALLKLPLPNCISVWVRHWTAPSAGIWQTVTPLELPSTKVHVHWRWKWSSGRAVSEARQLLETYVCTNPEVFARSLPLLQKTFSDSQKKPFSFFSLNNPSISHHSCTINPMFEKPSRKSVSYFRIFFFPTFCLLLSLHLVTIRERGSVLYLWQWQFWIYHSYVSPG